MKLNHDFEDLRRRLRRLQAAKVERRIDLAGLEALAECYFRLSLHPSTPNDERVTLLALAYMHAPTNPKYAYHMGLLYLKRGQLDRAAIWLEAAVRRSPNSHRVWVHVSLLQSQLNARYAHHREYEKNDLRERSAEVKRNVSEGADRFQAEFVVFEPRRSAAKSGEADSGHDPSANNATAKEALPYARRLVDEGRCRWPSVYELALEDALQAVFTRRSLERAIPLMEHTVRTVPGRRGGTSAFAIAAIQWLTAGYPAEEIDRWRATLTVSGQEPAIALVDQVLKLYRAATEDLPALLRQALAESGIPPYLGALVHYQRLMAPALPRFKEHMAFRLAQTNFRDHCPGADDTVDAEVAEVRRRLEGSLRKLHTGEPVDRSPAGRPPPSAGELPSDEAWTQLHGDAALLKDVFKEISIHAYQLMNLAGQAEPAGSTLQRLVEEGRQLVSIHKSMQGIAEMLSSELDSYLARTLHSTECRSGFIEAGQTLRDVLNEVRYSSLRYLQDEVELHASSGPASNSVQGTLNPVLQSLQKILEALDRGRSDKELKEVAASAEIFLEAERIAPRLVELQGQLFADLKATREEAKTANSHENAVNLQRHAARLKRSVERCDRGAREALRHLSTATKEISRLPAAAIEEQIGVGYPSRRDKAQKQLAQLGSLGRFKRVLKQIDRALESIPDGGAAPPNEAAEEVDGIHAEMEKLFAQLEPAGGAAAETLQVEPVAIDAPTAPRDGDTPADKSAPLAVSVDPTEQTPDVSGTDPSSSEPEEAPLRDVLTGIMAALSDAYANCRERLEAALGSHRDTVEYRELMAVIDSREAEMLHALGLRRKARQVWERMSRRQPAHVGLLKNIAVCASYEPDRALGLSAWRRYLEALYYYDAVLAKPSLFAPERKELHEGIGMALMPQSLPRFFYKQDGKIEPDEQSRVSLIEQHEQMRQYVFQTILMFFNSKVDFRSPLLFLGVDRGESSEARTAAGGRLKRLCDTLTAEFDWPVFKLYVDRVRDHIEDQLEICRNPANLTHRRDPHFQNEKPAHLEWLREMCLFKIRLRNLMLAGDLDYLDYVSWPAMIRFIDVMIRLDEIPVDLSPSFLADLALELQAPGPQLTEAAGILGALLIQHKFARRPLNEPGNLSESLYRQMIAAWSSSSLVGREVPAPIPIDYQRLEAFLDDPSVLYHERAQSIARSATDYDEVIGFLESWPKPYGGITGPQRKAAELLVKNGKKDRAYELLSSCIEAARFPSGRRECRTLMKTLKAHEHVEEEEYDKALPTLKERVEEDEEGNVATLLQYLRIFAHHALDSGGDPGHEELMKTLQAWIERFREALEGQEIQQVLQRRDEALIVAFTAHLGDINAGSVDPRSAREALSHLIQMYPDVTEAYVWRMQASYRIAEKEQDRGRESSALKALEWVRLDARYVRDYTADEDRRKLAEHYLEDAERLEGRPDAA